LAQKANHLNLASRRETQDVSMVGHPASNDGDIHMRSEDYESKYFEAITSINKNCIDCSGGSVTEALTCHINDCPLHKHKFADLIETLRKEKWTSELEVENEDV